MHYSVRGYGKIGMISTLTARVAVLLSPPPLSPPYHVCPKTFRHAFRREVLLRLPTRQRVRLGEEITHELVMVTDWLPFQLARRLAVARGNELARDNAALVQELVEAVLAIRAWLTKHNLTTDSLGKRTPVQGDTLAVALHIDLCSKPNTYR